ncbi:hypothetical protein V1514DRAFT_74499 [Lipomyces japonicus]|uniref:uncharacterized protein n=1 Tax=Lipomyces japonicus TaxID=56871 RepID=UPI0034D00AA0
MKFGKYLAKRQLDLPEYSNYFINYKALKKLIKSLGHDPNNKNASKEDIEATLQAHKVTFFFRLERELEKVNAFYLQKEADLKLRLASLLEKKKIAKSKLGTVVKTSATFIALYEGFFRFRRDLDKLEQFIELNATGFSKVLKKWDKRSKSQTKELYLSTAVEVQPVFHREEIAELSDLATSSLLELEAWADGEDVSFDHKPSSDSSQIERTNEELDDDFLRNLGREPDVSIHEWIVRLQNSPDAHERITRIFFRAISREATDATLKDLYQTGQVDLATKDDVSNRTVLHEAAISGRDVVLEIILRSHEKVTIDAAATDIYGRTPLHYAALHGHKPMIKPFLAAGAPIDALDQDNFTALLFAISQDHASSVEELILCGARVDAASEQDYIPLSMACQKGLYSITELLLKSNAAIIADAEGLYPQHLISQAGHHELIPLLKAYGGDINTVDKLNGWIAIFYAASEGHYETVKVLLENGADLSFTDNKNLSPLYYAAWEGHLDCVQLLQVAASKAIVNNINNNVEDDHAQAAHAVATITNGLQGLKSSQSVATDIADVDAIPDLSLPPPILPLRRYGHNFLDHKTFIEISFETAATTSGSQHRVSTTSQPPIRFFADSNIPAAKLTISSKLLDVIPRSLLLPLADDLRTVSFQVDRLDEFAIDFEIFPTFGSRIVAKTAALSHHFNAPAGTGVVTLPLFDLRLQIIGDLTFRFNVIKPYQGIPLEITNFDVYWKSTSQIEPGSVVSPASVPGIGSNFYATAITSGLTGALASTSVADGAQAALSSLSSSSSAAAATTTVPVSFTGHHHFASAAAAPVHSQVTASSLSGCYARVFVQVTRDLVPVVYPLWTVDAAGVGIPVCQLTLAQFQGLAESDHDTARYRDQVRQAGTAADAFESLYYSFLTLAEAVRLLPLHVNLDICVIYPTEIETRHLNIAGNGMPDLNTHADAILSVVFDHARQVRHKLSEGLPGNGHTNSDSPRNRSLIFSSSHPNVCTVLNWKQPNFPVFFSVNLTESASELRFRSAHDLPVKREQELGMTEDRRCGSLREASSFASKNNLMGIIYGSKLLNIVPALIESIRASGLVLVAQNCKFEKFNGGGQASGGADGVRDEQVLEFNETIDM